MYLIAKEGYIKSYEKYRMVDERDNSVTEILGKQLILSEKMNPNFIINLEKDKKGYKITSYPEELECFAND